MAGHIRIGCSGWSYPHWRRSFYPEKLPAREQFAFYAQHFDTVELNNSFYRQPTRERFIAWGEQAPPGFMFAVKGSRYITHIKRLAVEPKSIDLVVDAARGLGDKLGPILFQLQANFDLDLARLRRFVALLPTDLRFTLEFRNESWLVPSVFDLLRAHRIALCIPDDPKMPKSFEITSDFTYIGYEIGVSQSRPDYSRGTGVGAEMGRQQWAGR